MNCISSASITILLNGGKLDSFNPKRGLRQGDPMSPYVFILCMEVLRALINQEIASGDWKHISTSKNGPAFSHLFFVDDLVIFSLDQV